MRWQLPYGDVVRLEIALDELHNKRLCEDPRYDLLNEMLDAGEEPVVPSHPRVELSPQQTTPRKRVRFEEAAKDNNKSAKLKTTDSANGMDPAYLEQKRNAAIVIQKAARCMIARKHFSRQRQACAVIQVLTWFCAFLGADVYLQAVVRMSAAKACLEQKRNAAVVIQKATRRAVVAQFSEQLDQLSRQRQLPPDEAARVDPNDSPTLVDDDGFAATQPVSFMCDDDDGFAATQPVSWETQPLDVDDDHNQSEMYAATQPVNLDDCATQPFDVDEDDQMSADEDGFLMTQPLHVPPTKQEEADTQEL